VFQAGPNAGRRFRLGDGDTIIGRRSDCQIFVPDMRVSRQHARIKRENHHWAIEDLGSNNGTYVNGQRIQAGMLSDKDEILIASNRIRVELPEDASVTVLEMRNPSIVRSSVGDSSTGLRQQRLLERKMNALCAILEIAAQATEPRQVLDALCEALLDVFADAHSVGVLVEDEKSGELRAASHRMRGPARSRDHGPRDSDIQVPRTIIQHVVQDRRGILLEEPHLRAAAVDLEVGGAPVGSRMGAPIQVHGAHYGVIYVESAERAFRQEDVDLLAGVATQAGLALHSARMQQQILRKERLDRDLRVARQIQRSLLPAKPPDLIGLEFAVHYEPAYEIGGDFYDFIWHDRDHLAFVIGDVSGKAISAALYMARLTSELRSQVGLARNPARLLARVNEEMLAMGEDGMFATLVYAIYDLEERSLAFTNAGHVMPLLRREGQVYPLTAEHAHVTPIGVVPQMEIGEARVQLHTGDLLVLATDGIHEARDAGGNEYGAARLARRVRTAAGGPDDVVKAILQDVDDHVATGSQGDDITILAIEVGTTRARRRTDTQPPGSQPAELEPVAVPDEDG
jgi:serine phosphatase RsbU (regulator of sigma subunit)